MIYEYHELVLLINIGKAAMYYYNMLYKLGAVKILFYDDHPERMKMVIKTTNLRFKRDFKHFNKFYVSLIYVRQIQRYNYNFEKKNIVK